VQPLAASHAFVVALLAPNQPALAATITLISHFYAIMIAQKISNF